MLLALRNAAGAPDRDIQERRMTLLYSVVIVLVSSAVYFNALYNGFVFDDRFQILENPWISDMRYIPKVFTSNVWDFDAQPSSSNYYRPLMYLIYMIDYQLFELKPWGFHLVNILFHASASVLVFGVASRLPGRFFSSGSASFPAPAFIAALLFATHPIHTEAVTWVAGLPDVSATFFCLLAIYSYLRAQGAADGFYALSVASFFLAAFCKEPALTLPLILAAYDCLFRGPDRAVSLKRYIPFLAAAGIYLILRFHALQGMAPVKPVVGMGAYEYIINVLPLFALYCEKLLLPVNLSFWRDFHPIRSLFSPGGAGSLLIASACLGLIWLALKKNRGVCFCLILTILPLSPALYIKAIAGCPFGERYLYFPSVGFVILTAWTFFWAGEHIYKRTIVSAAILLSVLGFYSAETVMRNFDWKDNNTLYADTLRKSGSGEFLIIAVTDTLYNANKSLEEGRIDEAIEGFLYALTLKPDYVDAYNKLGIAYEKKGWTDKAIGQLQIAVKLSPSNAGFHTNLGNVLFAKGRTEEAITQYEEALALNNRLVEAHYNLGMAYKDKGLADKAIEHLEIAASLNPADPLIRQGLAQSHALKGKHQP